VFDAAEIVVAVEWEQAGPILFLLSNDPSNITGSIMATDGGWTTY
jgi:NAD(P)-dependent dehydrogenase (short-subunit alcohol dehydrogenase family)